jgi:uncharacterized membrane protein
VSDPGGGSATSEGDERLGIGLGRILALSDGVFAIALTLLVLDIFLPRQGAGSLSHQLLHLYPRYLAYALSFAVIARFWLAHHFAYRYIDRYDSPLLLINLLLLFLVAFLPFPTRVMGQHGDEPAATFLYAISVGAASAASAAMWWYATWHRRLIRGDTPPEQIRAGRVRSAVVTILFAASIPVSLFAPYAAVTLWLLAFVLVRIAAAWASARERARRAPATG